MPIDHVDQAPEFPYAPNPEELRGTFGDQIFAGGLYRVLSNDRAVNLEREISIAYPDVRNLVAFATTWLGDALVVDPRDGHVNILEPGTAKMLNTGRDFQSFQTVELYQDAEAALAASLFHDWRAAGGAIPKADECVGYRQPLFQGGEDAVENVELVNLDVYWTVTAPFMARVRAVIWREKHGGG